MSLTVCFFFFSFFFLNSSWKSVADYIDQQFEQYFRDESGLNRKNIQDNRVHCCLYFISPFGHGYDTSAVAPSVSFIPSYNGQCCTCSMLLLCIHHLRYIWKYVQYVLGVHSEPYIVNAVGRLMSISQLVQGFHSNRVFASGADVHCLSHLSSMLPWHTMGQ